MRYLRILVIVVTSLILVQSSAVFALARGHDGIAVIKYYNPKTGKSAPFFPIGGWYLEYGMEQDGRHTDWDLIVASGANVVHMQDLRFSTIDIGPFLDGAHKHGIKVVLGLQRHLMTGVDPAKPETYAELAKIINTYKSHPAILGWMMGDENEIHQYVTARDTVNTAKVIRRLDPNRQIWQVFSGLFINNWELIMPYMPGTDVVSFDQYFETDNRKTFEGCDATGYHVTNDTAFASQQQLSCTMVVQSFGNDFIPGLDKWRIPEYAEFRWNVFFALTSGARGIDLWIFPANMEHWYKDPNDCVDFVKNTVGSVMGELKQIKGAMETGYNVGKVEIDWIGKTDELRSWSKNYDSMLQLLLYDDEQKNYFLIVTNNTSNDRDFKITISDLPATLKNPKTVMLKTGWSATLKEIDGGKYQLEGRAGDHEVIIYRISSN